MAKRRFDVGEPPDEPVPESVSFRTRRRNILPFVVAAAVLVLASILAPGKGIFYLRGLGILVALLCLRSALMRWVYRVRMNPDGILVTGERGVPWPAIHGGRTLGGTGFEFQYTGPEGEAGTVRVPGNLERGDKAFRTFRILAERHGASRIPD